MGKPGLCQLSFTQRRKKMQRRKGEFEFFFAPFAFFAPLRENFFLARRRLLCLVLRGGFDQ